jgi:hypothetical protein
VVQLGGLTELERLLNLFKKVIGDIILLSLTNQDLKSKLKDWYELQDPDNVLSLTFPAS